MSDKILTIKKSTLVDIANQIREKNGSTDLIKVADLDDAVAELSGGGVVEVDVLPEPTVVVPGTQGPIPAEGYVDTVYINTSLSNEEVVAEIEKIPLTPGNAKMVVTTCESMSNLTMDDVMVGLLLQDSNDEKVYVIENMAMVSLGDMNGIYWIDPSASTVMPEMVALCGFTGWNPNFNGEIKVNKELLSPDVSSEQLEQISNLFYTCEIGPNPEFNAEAIYKLPDETLWMYKDNEWIELVNGAVDVLALSPLNNPNLGFYYGQTFALTDPITINIPGILVVMKQLGIPEFAFFDNSVHVAIRVPFPYDENHISLYEGPNVTFGVQYDSDTNECTVSIGTDNQYFPVKKYNQVDISKPFTFTMQDYIDVFEMNVDTSLWAVQYGTLVATDAYGNYDTNSIPNVNYKPTDESDSEHGLVDKMDLKKNVTISLVYSYIKIGK